MEDYSTCHCNYSWVSNIAVPINHSSKPVGTITQCCIYYTVSVALSGDGSLIPNAGWRHTDFTITLPIIDHFLAGDKRTRSHFAHSMQVSSNTSKITFSGTFVAIGRLLQRIRSFLKTWKKICEACFWKQI